MGDAIFNWVVLALCFIVFVVWPVGLLISLFCGMFSGRSIFGDGKKRDDLLLTALLLNFFSNHDRDE
jgi:hypothetical protein